MVARKTTKADGSNDIIIVEWADACASLGWTDNLTDDESIASCTSVGRIVHEDKNQIVLAGTWSGDYHNQRMAIPVSWIRSRTKITRPKK